MNISRVAYFKVDMEIIFANHAPSITKMVVNIVLDYLDDVIEPFSSDDILTHTPSPKWSDGSDLSLPGKLYPVAKLPDYPIMLPRYTDTTRVMTSSYGHGFKAGKVVGAQHELQRARDANLVTVQCNGFTEYFGDGYMLGKTVGLRQGEQMKSRARKDGFQEGVKAVLSLIDTRTSRRSKRKYRKQLSRSNLCRLVLALTS
jgi:hypothetical protein